VRRLGDRNSKTDQCAGGHGCAGGDLGAGGHGGASANIGSGGDSCAVRAG
jgi:hypothetical protein